MAGREVGVVVGVTARGCIGDRFILKSRFALSCRVGVELVRFEFAGEIRCFNGVVGLCSEGESSVTRHRV